MKIGLALGGGGARGLAHLGVWQRLDELGVPIHCIAGTSIGAIAGAIIAAGRIQEALAWCAQPDWKKLPPLMFGNRLSSKALMQGRRVEKLIAQLIGVRDFSELAFPFAAVATDFHTGEPVVMREGDVLSATLKGKGVALDVAVSATENFDGMQGKAVFGAGVAYNSPWGIEGAEPLPVFADDASLDIPVGNGTLTLKFGAKGVVTCTYAVGKNATTGSTQICAIGWDSEAGAWTADVAIALAAKKDKKNRVLVPALVGSFRLKFAADDDGNVVPVEVVPLD